MAAAEREETVRIKWVIYTQYDLVQPSIYLDTKTKAINNGNTELLEVHIPDVPKASPGVNWS